MDPRKRDEQRERKRKRSLRHGSQVIYTPVEGDFDSPFAAGSEGADNTDHSLNFDFGFRDVPIDQPPQDADPAPGTRSEQRRFLSTQSVRPNVVTDVPSRSLDDSSTLVQSDKFSQSRIPSTFRNAQMDEARPANLTIRGNLGEEDAQDMKEVSQQSEMQLPVWRKTAEKQSFGGRVGKRLIAAKNFILRRDATLSAGLGREVPVETFKTIPRFDVRTGGAYCNNLIRSSKYSYWSFFPRQLIFQFSKFANIYFLCISILQMIPGLSTTGTYTTIIPLFIFVMISMAKEGLEDLRRHKLDKTENRASVVKANGNNWDTILWQDLFVGDIIKLGRDEAAPADLIVLHADGAEDRAYVETMALDGETNLKNKGAPDLLQKMELSAEETLARNDISIHAEDPNLDLYSFSGNISVGSEKMPLTNDNVIYRGSILRNTKQVIGLIVYTGEECKIRMNANKRPRIKAPKMQALVNKVVLFIVALVIGLAIILTILYTSYQPREQRAFYLRNAGVEAYKVFVSFIIMLNTMIPLSLYVSMEIVKICQIALMMSDVEMYDPITDTPMEARTSTINEELGQVSYVFSDKTGTLTDNIMKFRSLSVAGTAWLHRPEADDEDYAEYPVAGKDYNRIERPSLAGTPLMGKTEDLIRQIQERPNTDFAEKVRFFILSIALCHTCVSEKAESGFDYSATSPDEVALAQAAQEMNFIFVDRKAGTATVRTTGPDGSIKEETYTVLEVLEFSSKRKRMSLIVRMPNGQLCVLTKGADSIVKALLRQSQLTKESSAKVQRKATMRKSIEAQDYMRRKSVQQARYSFARASKSLARQSIVHDADNLPPLSPMSPMRMDFAQKRRSWHEQVARPIDMVANSPIAMTPSKARKMTFPDQPGGMDIVDAEDPPQSDEAAIFEKCFQHVDYFATDGLRTLLYAYRYLDEDEYKQWHEQFHEASTSLTDRDAKIEFAAAMIEQGLELAGATAIEDKLQDGVPLAIDRLRRAGIKVWVLTGDKRETAINIGKSCQLIKDFSRVAILDHEQGDVFMQIQAALSDMREAVHSVVVVDGQTLSMIEEDESLFDFFHALAVFVDSLLCCRASPAQKAFLVKSIRTRVPDSVTLAIGDGSNDVAMIQEAHVGIGIAGREGLQAARTSDYSIAQFRFLVKLLLVHGRWNYLRICKYTLSTFWKEMLFFLTQAMFQMYNGYTGTSLYESWSLSMFNTLFSSLPVIFIGVFEKDLAAETLVAVPELYNYGQRARGFNIPVYLGWASMAAGNAALVFYLPMTLYGQAPFKHDPQLFAFGTLCYTAAILVINFKLQFWEIHYKTVFAALSLVLEIGGWFLWNIILAAVYHDNTIYKVRGAFIKHFGRDGLWWLTLILTVAMCFAFEMGAKLGRQVLLPNDVDVHQKLERDPTVWRHIETAAHADELDEEPGANKREPPKRTRTQQLRRDEEYDLLLRRNRSGTLDSHGSGEGIRKMPGKLVRFITHNDDSKTLGGSTPNLSSAPQPGTKGGTPPPTWQQPPLPQQEIEMSSMYSHSLSAEEVDERSSEQASRQAPNEGGKLKNHRFA